MSEYKISQYDLQSYFKSLCNSFYIAYEHVKRLEKEQKRIEAEGQEFKRIKGKLEELERTLGYWEDNMWADFRPIESVLYKIKNNGFSIIVTTKEEIYALIMFYNFYKVKDFPIINIKACPTGEQLYDDFILEYKKALNKDDLPDAVLISLNDKYL